MSVYCLVNGWLSRGCPLILVTILQAFGSQLAMKDESLYKISTLMGNSPEICRRHYPALPPESLGASVKFPCLPRENHLNLVGA
jgi:hypothetical protein